MTLDSLCVHVMSLLVTETLLNETHFNCNNLSLVDDQVIKNENKSWFCVQWSLKCSKMLLFTNINNLLQSLTVNCSGKQFSYHDDINWTDLTCLMLKPPENLSNFFNQYNDFSSDQKQNYGNIKKWKYYNLNEIQNLSKLNEKHATLLFHINACAISKTWKTLELLLDSTHICFGVIAITETSTAKDRLPFNGINLTNYSYEYYLTELSAEVTVSYIGNHLLHKRKIDLCIYKTAELESAFIELIQIIIIK